MDAVVEETDPTAATNLLRLRALRVSVFRREVPNDELFFHFGYFVYYNALNFLQCRLNCVRVNARM